MIHIRYKIDRYIRDIDREIKEQETSLSLGLRPGTHPAAIVLPEVVLPKSTRSTRIQDSPISEDPPTPPPFVAEAEVANEDSSVVNTSADIVGSQGPPVSQRRKSRSHGWSKKKKVDNRERKKEHEEQENIVEVVPPVADNENKPSTEVDRDRSMTRLTVTLPPLASLQQPGAVEPPLPDAEAVNPDEEKYCYCNNVSYGEVCGFLGFASAVLTSCVVLRWSDATVATVG